VQYKRFYNQEEEVMQRLDKHLTNDSVQKYTPLYGKHEHGNKLMFKEISDFIDEMELVTTPGLLLRRKEALKNLPLFKNLKDEEFGGDGLFWRIVYPQMTDIASSCVKATWSRLDPSFRHHNFQVRFFFIFFNVYFVSYLE
jgi:hypothetical protein